MSAVLALNLITPVCFRPSGGMTEGKETEIISGSVDEGGGGVPSSCWQLESMKTMRNGVIIHKPANRKLCQGSKI